MDNVFVWTLDAVIGAAFLSVAVIIGLMYLIMVVIDKIKTAWKRIVK